MIKKGGLVMKNITKYDELFKYFDAYFKENGQHSTYKEAAIALGYATTRSVHVAVSRARKNGYDIKTRKISGFSDTSLTALSVCVQALETCDRSTRKITLDYLVSRYGLKMRGPA